METLISVILIYGGICFIGMSVVGVTFVGFNVFSFVTAIISIPFLYFGITKTWMDIAMKRKGVEKYGIVVECFEHINRHSSHGDIYYYTIIVMFIDDRENIVKCKKTNVWKYDVGTFLKVKHYKNDINILDEVDGDEILDFERIKLESCYNDYLRNVSNNK